MKTYLFVMVIADGRKYILSFVVHLTHVIPHLFWKLIHFCVTVNKVHRGHSYPYFYD